MGSLYQIRELRVQWDSDNARWNDHGWGDEIRMRHFIGGTAIGLMIALWKIHPHKQATQMGDGEFCLYVSLHFFVAVIFGLAAWGLLP